MTHLRCMVVPGAPSVRCATRFSSIGYALLLGTLLGACASSQPPAPVASADLARSHKQSGKPVSGSRSGAGTASAVGGDGVGSVIRFDRWNVQRHAKRKGGDRSGWCRRRQL